LSIARRPQLHLVGGGGAIAGAQLRGLRLQSQVLFQGASVMPVGARTLSSKLLRLMLSDVASGTPKGAGLRGTKLPRVRFDRATSGYFSPGIEFDVSQEFVEQKLLQRDIERLKQEISMLSTPEAGQERAANFVDLSDGDNAVSENGVFRTMLKRTIFEGLWNPMALDRSWGEERRQALREPPREPLRGPLREERREPLREQSFKPKSRRVTLQFSDSDEPLDSTLSGGVNQLKFDETINQSDVQSHNVLCLPTAPKESSDCDDNRDANSEPDGDDDVVVDPVTVRRKPKNVCSADRSEDVVNVDKQKKSSSVDRSRDAGSVDKSMNIGSVDKLKNSCSVDKPRTVRSVDKQKSACSVDKSRNVCSVDKSKNSCCVDRSKNIDYVDKSKTSYKTVEARKKSSPTVSVGEQNDL